MARSAHHLVVIVQVGGVIATTDTKCLVELDHFILLWYKGRVAYKPLKLESRPSPVFFQRFTGGWWDSVSYEEDSA